MELLCEENTGQQGLTPLHCQLQLGRTEVAAARVVATRGIHQLCGRSVMCCLTLDQVSLSNRYCFHPQFELMNRGRI